jgi:hypothetical protein
MKAYQLIETLKSLPPETEIVYKVTALPNGCPVFSSLVLEKVAYLENEPNPIAILKTCFKDNSRN